MIERFFKVRKFSKNLSGQASVEFIVVIALVMVILTVASLVVYQKYNEGNELRVFLEAKMVCRSMADNIDRISMEGPGYYRYFTLQGRLHGNTPYILTFYENEPYIKITYTSENLTWGRPLVAPKVVCTNQTLSICTHDPALSVIRLEINKTIQIKIINREGYIYLENA